MREDRPEQKEAYVSRVPEIAVFDYDRCLGNVDAAMELFYVVGHDYGIDERVIRQGQRQIENDGGSFSPMIVVREAIGMDAARDFAERYIALGPTAQLMYSDAQPLLDAATQRRMPHTIMTYGIDPMWQTMKVRGAGYRGALDIITSPDKGAEIAGWYDADEKVYVYAGIDGLLVRSDSVSVVDDKAAAFASLHTESSTGFWLQRDGDLLPSQRGSVASNVVVIDSLKRLGITNGRLAMAA